MTTFKQYGLVGYPLGHSFSKRFFTQKFEKENINASFTNYEIANIEQLLQIVQETKQLKGFNVTIPHKQTIIPLLSSLSEEAKAIGAVNVVKLLKEGDKITLRGYNSDVLGFVNSIKPLIDTQKHHKALVLGTGGASKAIVYGLRQLGIHTQLVSRRKSDNTIGYDQIDAKLISQYQVIINCTPLGTFPKVDEYPDIPYSLLTSDHLLYDLVYNPEETAFLAKGKQQGTITKNGAQMLELQALEAWKIWNE